MENNRVKITNVHITNWTQPGDQWWDNVKAHPQDPLIEATITMTLTYAEYEKLVITKKK